MIVQIILVSVPLQGRGMAIEADWFGRRHIYRMTTAWAVLASCFEEERELTVMLLVMPG